MPGIFISYRREDASGHAGRLRDRLRERFGDLVFQDVDNIADGEIFENVLDRALASCQVALIIIGRDWLTCQDTTGRRRLDDPEDWVRIETRQLLGRDIRVVPVLVRGASMPRIEDLPEELRAIAKRQARELRDSSWDADVGALIQRLEEVLKVPPRTSSPQGGARSRTRMITFASAAVLVVVLAIASLFMRGAEPPGTARTPPTDSRSVAEKPRESANPIVAAANALGLPGTRWRIDDFSGMTPEPGTPDTYEFKVQGNEVLLEGVGADPKKHSMTVKQIQNRAITLMAKLPDGRPFEFMYVFDLNPDGSRLDNCQTVRAANFAALGPCSWRYHRATAAPRKTPGKFAITVKCGDGVPSSIDPACVGAAKAAGLIGTWRAGGSGPLYQFMIDGDAVRLSSSELKREDHSRLAVRSMKDGMVTLAWTGFLGRPRDFDAQYWYEYDLIADGSRLVNCAQAALLSTRTDRSQCSDVPAFFVREGTK